MSRRLSQRQRFQWAVALAAGVLVAYLLLPLWICVLAAALVLAFAVPPLVHPTKRRRTRH
jgi:predicted PurR-regulated permease PerM